MANSLLNQVSRLTGLRWTGALLVLAAAYFTAAKLGLSLSYAAEQVSPVWPPSGLALAAVLLYGYRVWPGIVLGAFLANATAQEPLATAAGIAVGNTLEAIAGAWLVRRVRGFDNSLERLKDVLYFIVLAAGVSTTVSATIGVTSLCLGGVHPWANYGSLWWVWWFGDATGDLLVAPVLLAWAAHRDPWPTHRLVEAGALLAGLIGTCLLVFGESLIGFRDSYALKYTVFPFIIWAALRFGQQGTTTVSLVASSLAIWGTLRNIETLGAEPAHARLLLIQVFMSVIAVTGLLLGAALSERRRNEKRVTLLHVITRILAESATLADATPKLIHAICQNLSWQVGALWRVDAASGVLRCVGLWHSGPLRFPEFESTTRQRVFEPGIGLPGRVWKSGQPAWIPDVVNDDNFPRAPLAAKEGLHSTFGFPILLGNECLGAIEFFSPEIRRPDEDVLRMMLTVGSQIGQFIERKQREQDVRHSEARKTAMLESALDAIITMDHEGNIVEFNPAAEKIFGYTRAEAIGKRMADLIIPPAQRETHTQGLQRYLTTGVTMVIGKRVEMTARRADGTEFPAELAITRIPSDGPPMFTGYLRDITQRKRDEETMREANRRKDEFLALLAHELRNPLAPIRNAVGIMKMIAPNDGELKEVRDLLERQVGQMSRLVDDLLDVSRITRGKIKLKKEPIEVAAVVAQAVETSRPLIDSRRQVLTVSLPPEPIWLEADATRLSQVFSNLLNNAAKFTAEGGSVSVTAERTETDVLVSVRDSGIGIPSDLLPRIFDLFAQADRSLDRSDGGLGIGLTLVRNLVEMHGGRVKASSDGLGKGSEFVVSLPLLPRHLAGRLVAPVPDQNRSATPRRRVLVVDDNQDAAESLGKLLQMQGHDVQTAHDGLRALKIAESFRPDVAVLDIGLPGMDGYEVARRIRLLPALDKVFLVAVTGYGQEADKRLSTDAGFNAHLVKPADLNALQTLLTNLH